MRAVPAYGPFRNSLPGCSRFELLPGHAQVFRRPLPRRLSCRPTKVRRLTQRHAVSPDICVQLAKEKQPPPLDRAQPPKLAKFPAFYPGKWSTPKHLNEQRFKPATASAPTTICEVADDRRPPSPDRPTDLPCIHPCPHAQWQRRQMQSVREAVESSGEQSRSRGADQRGEPGKPDGMIDRHRDVL